MEERRNFEEVMKVKHQDNVPDGLSVQATVRLYSLPVELIVVVLVFNVLARPLDLFTSSVVIALNRLAATSREPHARLAPGCNNLLAAHLLIKG
jgi:hypothetical protein